MTKKINVKKIAIGGVAIISVFGMGLYTNTIKLPITYEMQSQWTEDMATYEGTMVAADNVFVGKVIKQVGTQSLYEDPGTLFEVEIISNVKGDLQGTTIVCQRGGYKNGVLYRSTDDITIISDGPVKEKDNGLMKEGETYLFVTRYSPKENNYFVLASPKGTEILSKDKNLDKAALKSLYEKDERYIKLKEAYEKGKSSDTSVEKDGVESGDRLLQKIEE